MSKKPETSPHFNRAMRDQQERLKELACINRVTQILKEGKTIEETLMHLA